MNGAPGLVRGLPSCYIPKGVHLHHPRLQGLFPGEPGEVGQFSSRTLHHSPMTGSQPTTSRVARLRSYTTESFPLGVIRDRGTPPTTPGFRYTTIQNLRSQQHVQPGGTSGPRVHEQQPTMSGWTANLGLQAHHEVPVCYLIGEGPRLHPVHRLRRLTGSHQDRGGRLVHAEPPHHLHHHLQSISKADRAVHLTGGWPRCMRGLITARSQRGVRRPPHQRHLPFTDTITRTSRIEEKGRQRPPRGVGCVEGWGGAAFFYLMSRGMSEEEAMALKSSGVIEPIATSSPCEYAR